MAQVWGDRLLRAGGSVGANYREAQRGRSTAENVSKLGDCRREADESLYWLEHIHEEKLLSPARLASLEDEASQLIAIFITLIRKGRG